MLGSYFANAEPQGFVQAMPRLESSKHYIEGQASNIYIVYMYYCIGI